MIQKGTISIALDDDTKEIEAEIYGPIAVHETHAQWSYIDKPPYTVTHIKTGRAMAKAKDLQRARDAAREFNELKVDWWNVGEGDISSRDPEMLAQCKAIAARARG